MPYARLRSAHGKRRSGKSRLRAADSRNSSGIASDRRHNVGGSDLLITESTGNVFLDLGFPPDEAQNLLLRADLMIRIEKMIERRRLSQHQAAKLFGVTQPRISDLKRGKIERFSIDGLIAMLGHAGVEVEIRTKTKAA